MGGPPLLGDFLLAPPRPIEKAWVDLLYLTSGSETDEDVARTGNRTRDLWF